MVQQSGPEGVQHGGANFAPLHNRYVSKQSEIPMLIEKAVQADIHRLCELSQEAFEYDRQFDKTLNMRWSSSAQAADYFRDNIEDEKALVLKASVDQQIIGFLSGAITHSETDRQAFFIGEIQMIYINEKFRSAGIGTGFVKQFLQWCSLHKTSRIKVIVSVGNERAAKFYERFGLIAYTMTLEGEI